MNINVDYPLFFLILVPALLLGIIPFFKLHKKRRMSSKHLIPFIIHLTLIFLLTSLLAGVKVRETITAPTENTVVFVVDMSDSNAPMIKEMDDYIHEIMSNADKQITKFGLVAFGGSQNNGIMQQIDVGGLQYTDKIPSGERYRYLNLDYDTTKEYDSTDISTGLTAAKSMILNSSIRTNKRVVLMSDGRETIESGALSVAKDLLKQNIRVDAAYFDLANSTEDVEVQLVSLSTGGRVDYGSDITFTATVKSTSYISNASIMLYDASNTPIASKERVVISKGTTVIDVIFETAGKDIELARPNIVRAELIVGEDVLEQNNMLYSWFMVDPTGSLLIVEGDETQFEEIDKTIDFTGYHLTKIKPNDFPETLEDLLEYDEIVLMNVDFLNELPASAADNITRFVEEVGRGLFYTCGHNIYNFTGGDGADEENNYIDSPINKLLPVNLNVDKEKETVAMVLVIDLSSSMKELTDSKDENNKAYSRYQVALENVKKVITKTEFADNDFIGVVVFDQDYHVALDMQAFGDKEHREEIARAVELEMNSYYYYNYVDKNGQLVLKDLDGDGYPEPIPINTLNDGGNPGTPENKYYNDGYVAPKGFDPNSNNKDKYNNNFIKTYGTSYKWAIQAASDMLSKSKESLEIKQVVLISDGAPNDQGSGYEGIIERLARAGTVTSTIAIGNDSAGISILETLANLGKGRPFVTNSSEGLSEFLKEITDNIQGKYFNTNIDLEMKRNDQNSVVHKGVDAYDNIYGFYGTTPRTGATNAVCVDGMKPIYAEWIYGNGKVGVFMSNFGKTLDEKTGEWLKTSWADALYDNTDGIDNRVLIKNMFLSPMEKRIDASGLKYTITTDGKNATIVVTTYIPLRTEIRDDFGKIVQYEERLRCNAYHVNLAGELVETGKKGGVMTRIANNKYSISLPIETIDDKYVVEILQEKIEWARLDNGSYTQNPILIGSKCDEVYFAVTGAHSAEYKIFDASTTSISGELMLNSIAASGGGNLVDEDEIGGFFDTKPGQDTVITHDEITIFFLVLALILFVLDIIFRNFAIKRKKQKVQMTDEEQIASMRGR